MSPAQALTGSIASSHVIKWLRAWYSEGSQRHEGWVAVGDGYDDGGYSGGNLDRPGLKRLMADIEAGGVDIVVVYKIDRLTRSLPDFAKLVDVFDRNGVSFVSVTQQFNTTTSMGRLTLNILLSFAQFEREVTGERIRDKIAASKAKGMWMGGMPPLGYDVVERKLVVNASEANLVRGIFRRYAEHGSAAQLVRELAIEGHTTKSWVTQGGQHRPGHPIDQQYLFALLRNRIYVGEMVHKGQSFPGQHEAIVPKELWNAAHAFIERRKQGPREHRTEHSALLAGLLFAPDGQRMIHHFMKKKKTTQLKTLPEDTTLFVDLEAGDLAVKDWRGDCVRPTTWPEFRDLVVFLAGPNPALPAEAPYSEAHYQHVCERYGDPAQLAKYDCYFVDSITVLARLALIWAKTQPQAMSERTGKPDTRGAYGLLGTEMLGALMHLQHARGKHVVFVSILDERLDDFNRKVFVPQIEGAKTSAELPGIVDEVVTLAEIKAEDGSAYRAFVTHTLNPYGFPAKDRSGQLDLLEPPDLRALIEKCATATQSQITKE